jgi:hypothetical protein
MFVLCVNLTSYSAMDEAEYIQQLQQSSKGSEWSPATLALADKAVAVFPKSARLWCLRGNVICR